MIYRDITDRKRLENELRRSETYLAAGQLAEPHRQLARKIATGEIVLVGGGIPDLRARSRHLYNARRDAGPALAPG